MIVFGPKHVCPFPGCKAAPGQFMCPEHWQLVGGPERRLVINELKAMRDRNSRRITPVLVEALELALKSALVTLRRRTEVAQLEAERRQLGTVAHLAEAPAAP